MKAMVHVHALGLTLEEDGERNQCDGCAVGAEVNSFGHHRYPDGSLIGCTADRYVINGIAERRPTDEGYEYRTIALDAERAWKMQEPLHRALSWPKGSKQELWWLGAYYAARDAS